VAELLLENAVELLARLPKPELGLRMLAGSDVALASWG
jgi:hypothetical protein